MDNNDVDDMEDEDLENDNEEASPSPIQFMPPALIRKGAAMLTGIGVLLLALGRVFLWHGTTTSAVSAILLFFVAIYTSFIVVQLIFGLPINDLYSNFAILSGKQKGIYAAMIVSTLALLWLLCHYLFPGIGDRIHR